MTVSLKEVASAKDEKTFIYLPERIHRGHASWLPPIYMDEKKYFNPKKNPSFISCNFRKMLAFKDGKPVGRIMGIINRQHNEMFGLKNARFGFLECYNDQEVSHALIHDIEQWGRQHGMNKIIGPFGFSDRDIQGLLIQGFEYEPVVDSACNFEFLPELVTQEGYVKDIDCVIYRCPVDTKLPDIFERMYKRVLAKKAFQFVEFTAHKQLKPFIVPVLKTLNESFTGIYGFIPMDEVQMYDLAKRYLPLLDHRFVKLALKDNKVAAFMVSMPNPYRGIQKSRGRLLPFGIFHIMKSLRHAESINTMLGGVHPDFQKQGLDLFLGISTIEAAKNAGMKNVDTHVVMEENNDMMAEFKRYGAFLIKKFRVYQKQLTI
jgi:hypothetical protein